MGESDKKPACERDKIDGGDALRRPAPTIPIAGEAMGTLNLRVPLLGCLGVARQHRVDGLQLISAS